MVRKRFTVLVLVLLFATTLVGCGSGTAGYIDEWSSRLAVLDNPAATRDTPPSQWTDGIWVRRFDSGEWIAVRATDPEVSHRSGGADITVFCDSNGLVQVDTSTHVCTFDALDEYLGEGSIEATDLAGFYEALEASHWVVREP